MYIYAHADYYQDGVLTKRDIVLNRNSISVKLNVLREPSFVVTRNAGVSDSDGYYIDFEAKETKSTTSFALTNIHPHQIQHLKK